jgi:hypothetical protein
MINYHREIRTALNTILPTHYEMSLTSGTKTPCISYMEVSNYDSTIGSYQVYSRLQFQIKVWANDIAIIQDNALKIDECMRKLGFSRTNSFEMYDNNSSMIQKIMTYEAQAHELV